MDDGPMDAAEERRATLERLAHLCRNGRSTDAPAPATLPTGFQPLDALLPCGGWPAGALTELLSDVAGIGELTLLLPALAQLTRAGRYLMLIEPPWLPCAAALARQGLVLARTWIVRTPGPQATLWAAEQALRCPTVGAVLAWPGTVADRNLRRLQLAATAGGSLGVLYRPAQAALTASPAALRLQLQWCADPAGLDVRIHKARGGGGSGRHCTLALPCAP